MHSFPDAQRTTESNQFTVTELSAGPYLSAMAQVLPNLGMTGGLRYDTAIISAENKDASVDDEVVHAAFVYDGGLSYTPVDGFKIFTRYGTLFRYPFTDEQASLYGFGSDVLYKDIVPETGYNLEGGLSLVIDSRVSVHANLYYMYLRDEIAYNGATFRNENLDVTRRFGSNAGLTARPLGFLKLDASYAFVDAAFVAGANEGKRIPLVPMHSASGSLAFLLPAGLSLGPTLAYRSDAYEGGDYANALEKVDAYLVYGAQARWELESNGQSLAIQVTAKNLLDSKYAPLVFYGGYYPADGRSVSISVDYQY